LTSNKSCDSQQSDTFTPFEQRMRAEGLPDAAIDAFRAQYTRLREGATGRIPASVAGPVASVPHFDDLPPLDGDRQTQARAAMDRAVVLKLNGGLGTSMGLEGPKSLIGVHDGKSFLDLTVQQVLVAREKWGARLPLLLMNSFRTRDDSLQALAATPQIASDLPPDFLQGKVPKIDASDLSPIDWPADPELEWCPPGHGDLYGSLVASGMLEKLLAAGYETAFVSNADNLGATLEPRILLHVLGRKLPFLMEVARRTPADRKGGHLGQRADGQLVLREIAQCPPEELGDFQNIQRYRYFNTNSLWLHLPSLADTLAKGPGYLDLPMIRNEKPVDPRDPESPKVYQLETAMGSAIEVFEGAEALEIPRARFRPVKRSSDLLALRSDAYVLSDEGLLNLHPDAEAEPVVTLDSRYYGRVDDMDARFPYGPPSLRACRRLEIKGDHRFGRDVACQGEVVLAARDGQSAVDIPDGARLRG
jgi:UTP--glucose-1-phosphate uridylyltransferase